MKKPGVVPMAFLAIGLTLFQATARAQVVTTLAGSGASGSADGNGAEASFWNPSGLAVDSSGNVYVADTDNNKIRKLMPSGTVTTLAGSGNKGSADGKGASASFRFPRGIAVDVSGNVYVTEESFWSYGGGSDADIRKITPGGEVTTVVAALGPVVMFAAGLTVDISGDLYLADGGDVTDIGRGKILKVAPDGRVTTVGGSGIAGNSDGTGTAASFNYPSGVALDGLGNLYVADSGNNTIRRIALPGARLPSSLTGVLDVSVWPDGTTSFLRFDENTGHTSLDTLD